MYDFIGLTKEAQYILVKKLFICQFTDKTFYVNNTCDEKFKAVLTLVNS